MKNLLALTLSLALLGGLTPALIGADDAGKGTKKQHKLTEEQRKLRKEILDKYDANKDGKLDKSERAKISKEDQEKVEKAGLGGRNKKTEGGNKKESSK